MGSFFATLKAECFHLCDFEDVEQLNVGLKNYLDYCNRHRIKSRLCGISPVERRLQAAAAKTYPSSPGSGSFLGNGSQSVAKVLKKKPRSEDRGA
jgi:hypothetical protein